MILDPINDVECLSQLTQFARELVSSTLVRLVASHLRTRDNVIAWLQSLPQADDDGTENIRAIKCDVWQRTRIFPDDPNCIERSFAALMLLEVIEPSTRRALATVDKPVRHTGIVERRGDHWVAIDLFPRRNGDGRNFNYKALLLGAEQNVVRPVAKFYFGEGGASVIDAGIGAQNKLLGINQPNGAKKQPAPPPVGSPQRKPEAAPPSSSTDDSGDDFAALFGAGAAGNSGPGGTNGTKEETRGAGLTSSRTCACTVGPEAGARGDQDNADAGSGTQRFWRQYGWG